MDVLAGQERLASPEMVRARVLKDARRSWSSVDGMELERCVNLAVNGLWTAETRVTSFIPVLALRDVREMLEERAATSA